MICPKAVPSVLLKDIVARHPGASTEYLKVAEGGVYMTPTIVQTVLGSCLAAVFYAPSKRAGAIFHAFLPRQDEYPSCPHDSVFKFVDTAFAYVVQQFGFMGVRPAALNVVLVGGANGLVGESAGVGRKNAECALAACRSYGVAPQAVDLGGDKGRKIFFETSTGELHISLLKGIAPK